ncbi:MAG: hypothetical protein GY917_19535, partial [Planctomycetaceae bacterium]|nr:hypothetical protein [Planctomycetaceae bacterium]
VRAPLPVTAAPKLTIQGRNVPLESVTQTHLLKAGKWIRDLEGVVICFDLPRGLSHLSW